MPSNFLNILSVNTWGLPSFFTVAKTQRQKNLIQMINKLNPDIIAMQEVYLYKDYLQYKKAIPEYYNYYDFSDCYNKSGLVLFSKFKIKSPRIAYFSPTKNTLWSFIHLNKRAYQLVEILFHNLHISIINTHLSVDTIDIKTNTAQFLSLKNFTKRCSNLILIGDFNISYERFKNLNQNLYKTSGNNDKTFSYNNPYHDSNFNKLPYFGKKTYNRKVDYILTYGDYFEFCSEKVITKPLVSDHYPVYAEIKVTINN